MCTADERRVNQAMLGGLLHKPISWAEIKPTGRISSSLHNSLSFFHSFFNPSLSIIFLPTADEPLPPEIVLNAAREKGRDGEEKMGLGKKGIKQLEDALSVYL